MIQNKTANDSREIFSFERWIQPSIDEDSIPALNEKIVNGIYSTNADEEIFISTESNQAWFWTDEWQARHQAAIAELESGDFVEFENGDDFIASLDDIDENE